MTILGIIVFMAGLIFVYSGIKNRKVTDLARDILTGNYGDLSK